MRQGRVAPTLLAPEAIEDNGVVIAKTLWANERVSGVAAIAAVRATKPTARPSS